MAVRGMSVAVAARSSGYAASSSGNEGLDARVRSYWNRHVHDAAMSRSPAGTERFFVDLEAYRYDKLDYLQRVIDFPAYAGRTVLEIGCGIGLDLVRFARAGARTVGVDLSEAAIALAIRRFDIAGASGTFLVTDAATLPFPNASFDLVYCHGVLPYAADPDALIHEAHRVLRVGGEAVFMAYHRWSWLNALSRLGGVRLAHVDAPVFRTHTRPGLRALLGTFQACTIVTERFPVPTRLYGGWKASAFNRVLVPLWRRVPSTLVRPLGWHLLAFCRKLR